jgi:hypothetical protein
MEFIEAGFEALGRTNFVLMYLAALGGIMFGLFYKSMQPAGNWQAHARVGTLVGLTFFGVAAIERVFDFTRGDIDLVMTWFHLFHPITRWAVFIVSGVVSILVVDKFRDTRRL